MALFLLAFTAAASASTYCVLKPSCVSAGGTSEATINEALSAALAHDGHDRVELGTGTFDTGTQPIVVYSNNPVDIVGSGGATVLQNTASYAAVGFSGPSSTISDLTIRLSVENVVALDLGAVAERILIAGDTGRTGFGRGVAFSGAGTLRSATVSLPFNEPGVPTTGVFIQGPGTRTVEDIAVLADTGFDDTSDVGVTNVRRVRTRGAAGFTMLGGTTNIEDAVVELFSGTFQVGIDVAPDRGTAPSATVNASHVTIVGSGGGRGLRAVSNLSSGSQVANLTVRSSVVRNVGTTLERVASASPRAANLTISHSWYDPSAVGSSGGGTLTQGPGNTFTASPGFVDEAGGDYHLVADSPLLDIGKPGGGGSPFDFDKNPRITSGTGACVPRRDMGAFEFQPGPRAPHAAARVDPVAGAPVGVASTFTALNSCDPDLGDHLTYSWRFDDGRTAHGFSVRHRFTSRGDHDGTVTVTDSTGRTATATATAHVTAARRCVNRILGAAGADVIAGTRFGDDIRTFGGGDRITGRAGGDCIRAGRGDDRASGGPGKDAIYGEDGDDRLVGGSGNDKLDGGPGENTYSGGAGADRILAVNNRGETVRCGAGNDHARVDAVDVVRGCEHVTRIP
ncbi:MAG: cytochrome c [Thermoleophilaceae bacterium]|nr:cytochrome c [Thermoleophilaceae bacterium]